MELLKLEGEAGREWLGPEFVPGIRPIFLPLCFGPRLVTAWLLADGDSWTLIDCGAGTPENRAIWAEARTTVLANRPVRRILATHGHVDHIGWAGPLRDQLGRPEFLMTRTEWLTASLRAAVGGPGRETAEPFFASHGVPPDELEAFLVAPAPLQYLALMPETFRRIADGDTVSIGGRDWRVLTSGGHAPEHAALYCAEDSLLIAGDQVLPRITPFVGISPDQPEADPLGEFLAALERFEKLAWDTLVLPSHGPPFRGLHDRLSAIREHHVERLDEMAALARRPATAYDIAAEVFSRAMYGEHRRFALAETLAHLNRLTEERRLSRSQSSEGVLTFQS